MKDLKRIVLMCLIGLLLGACEEDVNFDFSQLPELFIEEGRNHQVLVGESLNLNLVINSTSVMRSLEVYKDGTLFQVASLEAATSLRHSFEFLGEKQDVNKTINLAFLVIDIDGNSNVAYANILINETPLAYTLSNASISNSNGSGFTSWDLITNQPRQTMENADLTNASTSAEGWVKGWRSTSQTRFVKLVTRSNFSLNTFSLEDLATLYQSDEPQSAVTVETGDWVIARLRNTNEYAIIRIDQVDEASDNANEKIFFTYQKTSENAGQD